MSKQQKTEQEITLTRIKMEIESSPLGFIRGDCRLLALGLDEWVIDEGDDFNDYTPEQRTISFAVGNKKLGELVIDKKHIQSSIFDQGQLDMVLHIEENGCRILLYIHCKSGFPGYMEFANFVTLFFPIP